MNLEKFQEYLDDILFENWRENSIFILFSLSIIMFTASMLFVYYIYTIIAALVYIYCSLSCTVLVYMHLQLTYTKTYTSIFPCMGCQLGARERQRHAIPRSLNYQLADMLNFKDIISTLRQLGTAVHLS